MKTDYTYCLDEGECLHRLGCKRNLANYKSEEIKELYTINRFVNEIDIAYCLDDIPHKYDMLVRFRNSDGSPLS